MNALLAENPAQDLAPWVNWERALRGTPRPLAFVDLDAFDWNLRMLAKRAGGKPIRLASKSLRSVPLIRRALAAPGYAGVLCYSGWEAAHLLERGIRDVVIGYPLAEPREIAAVLKSAGQSQDPVFMTDRAEHLAILSEQAREARRDVSVAVDLDLSTRFPGLYFGVRRSAVRTHAQLIGFLSELKRHPGLRLVGVLGYEAQIAGVPDRSWLVRLLKRLSWRSVRRRRQALVQALLDSGYSLRFVNGGGTGSLEWTSQDASVTELSAGSALYAPTLFDGYRSFRHESAAGFVLAVTRKPSPDVVTCFAGGYVASGSPGADKWPRPTWPPGLRLLAHEGAGEVQTPLRGSGARKLGIGDAVFFRHAKAGELCERFDELQLIEGGRLVGTAKTYRGEGVCFG